MNIEEVMAEITNGDIRWLNFEFVDVVGYLHSLSIPAEELSEKEMVGLARGDLGRVFGERESLYLKPDPNTFAYLPWMERTARMIGNIFTIKDEHYLKDPRYIWQRALKNAEALGFDEVKVGYEIEFYFFDNVTIDKVTPQRGPSVSIESREGAWNVSPLSSKGQSVLAPMPYDSFAFLRTQMLEILADNFKIKTFSHGHGEGNTGQQFVSLQPLSGVFSGDALITFKNVARNIAVANGLLATFMPLPIFTEKGCQLSINLSLWKVGKNLFFEEGNELNLSQTARYFVGGILDHLQSLAVFTNPTTNSYKRLSANTIYGTWSSKNRNAAVYVPLKHGEEEEKKRIKLTFPDPSVNPYLALSAILAAGLDGIKKKKEPSEIVDENIDELSLSEMKRKKITRLPKSLGEAIKFLESDNEYLKGTFTAEILASYLEIKIMEEKENEKRPTSYEYIRYFNL